MRDQYESTKALLTEKKDLVEALGNRLMEKETINLPDIIEILGERPYGMNETMQNYLTEMQQRKEEDAKTAAEEEVADEEIVDSASEEVKQD